MGGRAKWTCLGPAFDVKARVIEINGAEFSGDVNISKAGIPFPIHLKNCDFAQRLVIQDARFERSLVIEGSTFENGFQLQNTTLKEDLILDSDPEVPVQQITVVNLIKDVHCSAMLSTV